MIKRLLIMVVFLAVIAGGLVYFNLFRDKAIQDFFANMPTPEVTVSTVTAEARRWTPTIEAIGTAAASRGVDLTVETSGIITSLNFKANDRVEDRRVLVQLDDVVQRADLEAARTQVTLDTQALQRAVELQQRGVGTTAALQTAEAASQTSAAQVAKLEATLQQKQLRAPFSGTVGIPRVEVGQYLTPGTAVVTLQDLETMRADFTVPEQQLALLRIGQPVKFAIDGSTDILSGEVVGIDPKVDPGSRLVSLRATVANTDGKLSPGQFVRVSVELPAEDNIISLPQTAVVTSLYGDYVYAVRKAEPKPAAAPAAGAEAAAPAAEALEVRQVFVKLGRRSGRDVEVREGVAAGDTVVTAGQNRLSNGGRVKVDNTVNPANADKPSSPDETGSEAGAPAQEAAK